MTRRRRLHIVLAIGLTAGSANGQGMARQPILSASAQETHAYVSWSEIPDARYRLEWRRRGSSSPWTVRQTASARTAAVPMPPGAVFEMRVIAEQEARRDTSATVVVSARDRADCRARLAVNVFCSVADLRQFLTDHAIDDSDLTCAGNTVGSLTLTSPNCRYEIRSRRSMLILDRGLGGKFERPQVAATPRMIASIARRALWGADADPFAEPLTSGRLIASSYSSVGGVRRSLSATALSVRVTPTLYSRMTWFVPEHAVPGRFAIYHEGHELPGGGATKSAAEVIDWFLDRGWQVIAMDMLLNGENEVDRTYDMDSHNDLLRQVVPAGADPVVLMLDPIKAVVDSIYAEAAQEASRPTILLSGRSGGGFLTDLYSAVDPRIDVAVEIAGMTAASAQLDSVAFRSIVAEMEVSVPPLYDQIPAVLVQTAGGRLGSFHFYSTADPCCFAFPSAHPFVSYLKDLTVATRGRVRVYVGQQAMHGVDAKALGTLGRFLDEIGLGGMPADSSTAVR